MLFCFAFEIEGKMSKDPKTEESSLEDTVPDAIIGQLLHQVITLDDNELDEIEPPDYSAGPDGAATPATQTSQATQTTPTTDTETETETLEAGPSPSQPAPSKPAKPSVIMVEEPGTIIELVDLYVPPPPPIFLQPSQLFFMRQPPPPPVRLLPGRQPPAPGPIHHLHHQANGQLWCQVGGQPPTLVYSNATGQSPPDTSDRGQAANRGRKRGRKPAANRGGRGGARGGAVSGGRGGKRQRRLPSPPPPPLPPPPNFLENFINPLENDIYPRVSFSSKNRFL